MSPINRLGTILALSLLIVPPVASGMAQAAEQSIAPEKNPPGDIPDSQVFIKYAGHGFSMQVPDYPGARPQGRALPWRFAPRRRC